MITKIKNRYFLSLLSFHAWKYISTNHIMHRMIIKKAYTFRFYPTKQQNELLAKSFACCKVVYNQALNFKTRKYQENISYSQTSTLPTNLKREKDFLWLNEVSSVSLQQSLRDLDISYTNFFKKRSEFPKFKNKHSRQSIRLIRSAFSWDGTYLKIAKSKKALNIRISRKFSGNPLSVTITKDSCSRYFISILVEEETISLSKKNHSIGIDMGIESFITTSNNLKIVGPKPLKQFKKKLKKYRRRFKVSKIHSKIRNIGYDFHHKLATQLIRENQTIIIEGLCIKSMLKDRKYAKYICDEGWSRFLTFLKYKSEWYGRNIVELDHCFPGTQLGSICHHNVGKLDCDIRSWECLKCNTVYDRDFNASYNIYTEGRAVI